MANPTEEILNTLLEKVGTIAKSETIIGEPREFGDILLIPITKISIGFGAGGGGSQDGSGGGAGGGINIEPVGFIFVRGEEVKMLPVQSKAFGSIIDSIPDIVGKITDIKKDKKVKKDDEV